MIIKKPIGATNLPNQDVLVKISDIGGVLGYNGVPVDTAGSGGGSGSNSNLILGGTTRFSIDFVTKTISYTTSNLFTANRLFTLNAGSKTFPEIGAGTLYFICYKNDNIELANLHNIGSYTGYVIFGVFWGTVVPFSYPIHLLGIRGGSFFNRKDIAIGEWTLIGDSITFGRYYEYVAEALPVPVINNIAVGGRWMSGSGGMWKEKDNVTTTTELITIMGGTNDQGGNATIGTLQPVGSAFNTNTFVGAYQTLIEGLLARIPKAIIILLTPSRAWTDNTGTTERTSMKEYADMVKQIGQFYGLPVVDLYNEMGLNKLTQSIYLGDGLHPSVAGKRRIAALLLGTIRRVWMNTNFN